MNGTMSNFWYGDASAMPEKSKYAGSEAGGGFGRSQG